MDSLKGFKSLYRALADSYAVSHEDVEEFPFDEVKYQTAIEDVQSRLKVKLTKGFCSSVIIAQIARHYCGLGERFGDTIEFYHGSTILDTIELMETGKLKGEEFTKSRLIRGLLKEHHSALSQMSTITKNIFNGLSDKVVDSAKNRVGNNSTALLNTIHSEILDKKKHVGKLTGEWIVFAKVNGVNYYLCLATHAEGQGQAEAIYSRIVPTFDEFPALVRFKRLK